MTEVLDEIRHEIVELHVFFADWFNGTADRDQLDTRFISRLHPELIFITPEGHILRSEHLRTGFEHSYGDNTNFKIQIRDVAVRHESGDQVLATYTEWQSGATGSTHANNARFSSVLMKRGEPFQWLHLQETWLPEEVRAAEPFNF